VHESRFIVLSVVVPSESGEDDEQISWLLVSSNNRPLGRGGLTFASGEACRDAVARLREQHTRVRATSGPAEATGQWAWRADLDGDTVAVSSRTYLRHRECDYNLHRFLEAVPSAEVSPTVRVIRNGSRR
jgi:hypothetical protein